MFMSLFSYSVAADCAMQGYDIDTRFLKAVDICRSSTGLGSPKPLTEPRTFVDDFEEEAAGGLAVTRVRVGAEFSEDGVEGLHGA